MNQSKQDNTQRSYRLVLIDDDPSFGHIMTQLAKQRNLSLDFYKSLADLGYVSLLGRYDVAILDYDLGNMTGLEVGQYLDAFFQRIPMLLVSGTMRKASTGEAVGGRVRAFVPKQSGYEAILTSALQLISPQQAGRNPYLELGFTYKDR